MRNCIYKEESISAFIEKDEKEFEIRKIISLEIREASRNNQLLCEECCHPVEFRSGEFRTYFAHKEGFTQHCEYEESFKHESKAHREGKEVLYNYFRILYPDAKIRLDYRLANKRRANIYIEQDGKKLAVEFERFDKDVKEWEKKESDYRSLGISSIWIICEDERKMNLYEQQTDLHIFKQVLLNETENDMLVFLNIYKKQFVLLKNIECRNEITNSLIKDMLFKRTYGLQELEILLNGNLAFKGVNSFFDEYEEEKNKFVLETRNELAIKEHTERWAKIHADRAKKETDEKIKEKLKKEEEEKENNKYDDIPTISYLNGYNFEGHKYRRFYENKIFSAIRGDANSIKKLVEDLHYKAENYYLITYLFKNLVKNKYSGAEATYQLVMKKAGMDPI